MEFALLPNLAIRMLDLLRLDVIIQHYTIPGVKDTFGDRIDVDLWHERTSDQIDRIVQTNCLLSAWD